MAQCCRACARAGPNIPQGFDPTTPKPQGAAQSAYGAATKAYNAVPPTPAIGGAAAAGYGGGAASGYGAARPKYASQVRLAAGAC